MVWEVISFLKYRFKTKTLCDYLYDSLIFDLTRFGFNIISDSKSRLSFQEVINNKQIIPENPSYILGIDVLMCEPHYVSGWMNIGLFYYYAYHITIYDILKSKVIYDAELNRIVEGTPEVSVATFTPMVDKLLNDYLFEINYDIAEILVKYK